MAADLLGRTLSAKAYPSRTDLIHAACALAPKGAACEFGVHKGHSLLTIAEYRKAPVLGFDSFQGLPEAWDMGSARHDPGHFACEPPANLPPSVKLVPGWFEESIPSWLETFDGPVQFVHIDCDLYSSTKTVLGLLNDRLLPGAVLVFDELLEGDTYTNWREGEWRALVEWVEACGRQVRPIGRTAGQQAAFLIEV